MSQSALSEKRGRANWLPGFLRPPLPAAPITDPSEVRHLYSYYRPRILLWSTVGYGTFYFVRKNLSVAMPLMQRQLGLSKSSLGLILTLHGLVYGVSKFLGGIAADRANARIFMALALLASAVVNVFFGLSSSLLFLGIFWAINGLFQGLGYPPCRAAADPLVFAKGTGDENVDLWGCPAVGQIFASSPILRQWLASHPAQACKSFLYCGCAETLEVSK